MEQNVMQEETKNNKKKVLMITLSIIAVLIVIYLGLSVYFMGHFYFGTKIGNVSVSGKSAVGAEKKLEKSLDEYKLSIIERDGTISEINGDEISLGIDWKTKPGDYIEKQNGFAWIIKLFQPEVHKIDATISYQEDVLMDKIAKFPMMDETKQIAAVDAKVSDYQEGKEYHLIPSVPGTVVNQEEFYQTVKQSIVSLKEELNMAEENCYVPPVVTEDNQSLINAVDQMNKCLDAVITYKVGTASQVLDAKVFQPWLYVDENLVVCVSDEALSEYVKSLASAYNTCNKTKKFMTSYGKEITITNNHYGWKVDNDAEKAAIIADILAGDPVTRDLNYAMVAKNREEKDYGNSYVEINLTAQHLFLYVDGQLVLESDFVSGNESKRWNTPTGMWGVTYKTQKAILRGDNYATPVDYWMPYAGNVGMHDATWRDDFGGNIYKKDGSHGCINLPWGKAKAIYGYVSKGFPVVVYYLDGTQSEKGIAQDQADKMIGVIKSIGSVTLETEAKIVECRAQYDALSELAKKYVTNYHVLVEAEQTLAQIKNQAEVPLN